MTDSSCPKTVRTAFEGATNPLLLNVGVVQQNCHRDCKRGTGWGNTRRIVPQPQPDVDCILEFCASALGKPHCLAGRVRILRLNESESFGPFFARYLAAKLWQGETYFMQVDSHSNFRKGWDATMVEMIKKTPTFPHSVISNYPPGHTARFRKPGSYSPSALCGLTFEDAGKDAWTVRLAQSGRRYGGDKSVRWRARRRAARVRYAAAVRRQLRCVLGYIAWSRGGSASPLISPRAVRTSSIRPSLPPFPLSLPRFLPRFPGARASSPRASSSRTPRLWRACRTTRSFRISSWARRLR